MTQASKNLLLVLALLVVGGLFWYFQYEKPEAQEKISKDEAISFVQNKYPELKNYPSNELPPRSIRTEEAANGWYLAFVQEGSGIPIIDARCFFLQNDNSIENIQYSAGAQNTTGIQFSIKDCKLSGAATSTARTEPSCALENCHGLNIVCGANPPDFCTEMYGLGDRCLQFAKCGVQDGQCQQIPNTRFTDCKSCVQKCLEENKDNNVDIFACESKC